jgi:CheY-like chemotaxis protein
MEKIKPLNILVIEDNEMNRSLLRQVLTFHGYEVFEAESGEKGITLAKKNTFALIMLDIQMPFMDGFTTASILKNDPLTKDVPIIAVTSYAMKGDREKVLEAGIDDYISKPINIRQLPDINRFGYVVVNSCFQYFFPVSFHGIRCYCYYGNIFCQRIVF